MNFTKINTVHTNKYEIHKNRTLDKKLRQTPESYLLHPTTLKSIKKKKSLFCERNILAAD